MLMGFPQVSSGEGFKTFHYKSDNLSISIPETWKENSKRDILEYTQEIKSTMVPNYYFQLKNREPFSYPNVVIQIRKELIPREEILQFSKTNPNEYLDQINNKLTRGHNVNIEKPFYDEKNNIMWVVLDGFHEVLQTYIVNISGVFLTNDGHVLVTCVSTKKESTQYVDKCISIIKSVKILNQN